MSRYRAALRPFVAVPGVLTVSRATTAPPIRPLATSVPADRSTGKVNGGCSRLPVVPPASGLLRCDELAVQVERHLCRSCCTPSPIGDRPPGAPLVRDEHHGTGTDARHDDRRVPLALEHVIGILRVTVHDRRCRRRKSRWRNLTCRSSRCRPTAHRTRSAGKPRSVLSGGGVVSRPVSADRHRGWPGSACSCW